MDIVIFIIAMGGLIVGADFIINQSEKIALRFNVSEFILGATLIALGTSLPEMLTSMAASFDNKSEIAIANVVGSNIMNITLIMGVIFIVSKRFTVKRDFFAKDSIWLVMPIVIFLLMSIDGTIGKFDAFLLLGLMGAYLLFLLNDFQLSEEESQEEVKPIKWVRTIFLLLLGFILVAFGAHFVVESASSIAKSFGVSEWVIGIILISLGTSLPELIVSISAVLRGKIEMAIGNIIGSNLANTTMVLSSAVLVNELSISLIDYYFDMAIMLSATILFIYITANKLYNRSAGIVLLILLLLFISNSVQSVVV
jgi:cation:H+ antiporter